MIKENLPSKNVWAEKLGMSLKKDVHAHLKSKGLVAREKGPEKAPYHVMPRGGEHYIGHKVPVSHEDIHQLADKISSAVGNSYPDGDPHDAITSHMMRKGWEPSHAYEKLVPVALKKHMGEKHGDLHKHIHDVWKDADDSTGYKSAHHWKE